MYATYPSDVLGQGQFVLDGKVNRHVVEDVLQTSHLAVGGQYVGARLIETDPDACVQIWVTYVQHLTSYTNKYINRPTCIHAINESIMVIITR